MAATPLFGGLNGHINIRISHSGSKAQYDEDTRNRVLWDLYVCVVFWGPTLICHLPALQARRSSESDIQGCWVAPPNPNKGLLYRDRRDCRFSKGAWSRPSMASTAPPDRTDISPCPSNKQPLIQSELRRGSHGFCTASMAAQAGSH